MKWFTPEEEAAYKAEQSRRLGHLFDHVGQLAVIDPRQDSLAKSLVACGTGTLIRTPSRDFIVTCRHVYDWYQKARKGSDEVKLVLLGTGGVRPIDLSEAPLIDSGGRSVDLASIEAPAEAEITAINKRFFESEWPPRRAQRGELAIAFGMPTQSRKFEGDDKVRPKRWNVGGFVSSSSDRHFTIIDQHLTRVHLRSAESTIPSEEVDFGGISGGGVFVFDEGLRNPQLRGFVYETTLGIRAHVMVAHADFLLPDGRIDFGLVSW